MIKEIAVIGAGTMGSGIALACASAGYRVLLYDGFPEALEKGKNAISKNIDYLIHKGKISSDTASGFHANIAYVNRLDLCKVNLVIEAIIEKPEAKAEVFRELALINEPECMLVSNTSSLSINQLQKNIPNPGRFAGLHFFNPAHIMKLVEVVRGEDTSVQTIDNLVSFCKTLGKVPVVCNNAPGFIVNRVARNFYLEPLRIAETTTATPEMIDLVLENSGFKMGPFRLMDLIGMDINYAVSQSLYEALNEPGRLKPSELQKSKVDQGKLGRKSGSGFYDYSTQTNA